LIILCKEDIRVSYIISKRGFMKQHVTALFAAGITLGTFYGLLINGVPNAASIAGWVGLGTMTAGIVAAVVTDYRFRLDTFMIGIVGGAFATGFALKQIGHDPSPLPQQSAERKAMSVSLAAEPAKAFARVAPGMAYVADRSPCEPARYSHPTLRI
jgi:hypothetical protein